MSVEDDLLHVDDVLLQRRQIWRGSPVWLVDLDDNTIGRGGNDRRPFRLGTRPIISSTDVHMARSIAMTDDRLVIGGTQGGLWRVTSFDRSTGLQEWSGTLDNPAAISSGASAPAVAIDASGIVYAAAGYQGGIQRQINLTSFDTDGSTIVDEVNIGQTTGALSVRLVVSDGDLLLLATEPIIGGTGLIIRRLTTAGVLVAWFLQSGINTVGSVDVAPNDEVLILADAASGGGRKIFRINEGVPLTTRSSNSSGVITVRTGHSLSIGETVNLRWRDPANLAIDDSRLGVNIDNVSGNDITFSGGSGGNLPVANSMMQIDRSLSISLTGTAATGEHVSADAGDVWYVAAGTSLHQLDTDGVEQWASDLSGELTDIDSILGIAAEGCCVFGRNTGLSSATLTGLTIQSRLLFVDASGSLLWNRPIVTSPAAALGQIQIRRNMASATDGSIAVCGTCWPADKFDRGFD